MTRFLFFLIFVLPACSTDKNDSSFFDAGEFSKEPYFDSQSRNFYTKTLREMSELPLRSYGQSFLLRLSVYSGFHASYCIRISKSDSVILVTFKTLGDGPSFRPSGISKLSMVYESSHAKMDSLYRTLHTMAAKYYSYPPGEVSEGADGVTYLLESVINGVFTVDEGWSGDLEHQNSTMDVSLFEFAAKMQSFVPSNLLPSADNLYEDQWFPPLKSDTTKTKK